MAFFFTTGPGDSYSTSALLVAPLVRWWCMSLFPPWWPVVQAWAAWLKAYHWQLVSGWVGLMVLIVFVKWAWHRSRGHDRTTRGAAAFATRREMRQAGLLTGNGVIIGSMGSWWSRQYLRVGGESNVLVFGPKGSGKTTCVTIPTILSAGSEDEDLLIIDLKGELVRLTAPWRRGPDPTHPWPVYVFHPASPQSDRLNLLDLIRWGTPYEIVDAQRLATHLATGDRESVNQRPLSEEGQYYRRWAIVLLWGGMLYLHDAPADPTRPCSIRGLLFLFSHTEQSLRETLEQLSESRDPTVREVAQLVMHRTATDQKEVFSAAAGWLMPWFDPVLAYNTDATTIPLAQLQMGQHPMTLYLRFSPDDVQGRLRPVARLLLDQLLAHLTDRDPWAYHRRLKIIAEDMATLGYFQKFETIAEFYREHGISLLALVQSANQLWKHYGHDTALFDNMDAWVVFRPNHPESAEFFAKKLGKTTVRETMAGHSRPPLSLLHSTFAREQVTERDLLDPWELMQVRGDECLVFVSGVKPIKATARPYFTDGTLLQRMKGA